MTKMCEKKTLILGGSNNIMHADPTSWSKPHQGRQDLEVHPLDPDPPRSRSPERHERHWGEKHVAYQESPDLCWEMSPKKMGHNKTLVERIESITPKNGKVQSLQSITLVADVIQMPRRSDRLFRNPLQGILNYSKNLLDDGTPPASICKCLYS